MINDDDGQDDVGAEADQEEELWTTCEQFIIAMLTNFDTLSLERIHNMLGMTLAGLYNKSMPELSAFLDRMGTHTHNIHPFKLIFFFFFDTS